MSHTDNTDTPTLSATGTTAQQEEDKQTIQVHPDYETRRQDYILVRDCMEGEKQIKAQGTKYLPKTSAQKDQDPQGKAYEAYKVRAIYYNYPIDVLSAALGMLQREPATFEPRPSTIDALVDSATPDNESLNEVLADINKGQIAFGGTGLLVDIPAKQAGAVEGNVVPYILEYPRPSIVNWQEEKGDDGRNHLRMLTLSESSYEIQPGGSHTWVEKYRMCAIDSQGKYWTAVLTPTEIGQVDTKTFEVVAQVPVDSYPVGLAVSPDEKQLFVTSQGKRGGGGNSVGVYSIEYIE